TMNRTVDMGFRGKIDYRPRRVAPQQLCDQRLIADVAMHKNVAGIAVQARQVPGIARVRELIEPNHWLVAFRKPFQYKVGSNKTSGAGDKNSHITTIGEASLTLIAA